MWTYDPAKDICSTTPMTFLPLVFGGETEEDDVNLEFIYQPGYVLQTYVNHLLCIWNVTAPEDPCIFVEYQTLEKDLHAAEPFDGVRCDSHDHVHIRYSGNQFQHQCGNELASNCPFGNCITTLFLSGEF